MRVETRTLVGGPLDGKQLTWGATVSLRVTVPCPDGGTFDIASYDPGGHYEWSEHPGDRRYAPCGECSLCPGHLVEVTPAIRYRWGEDV